MSGSNFQWWAGNITFLRQRLKMSQDAFAAALNITRAKLAAIETGATKNPSIEDLAKFSDYFKVSLDSLVKVDLTQLQEWKLRELMAGNVTGANMRVLATTVDNRNHDNIELVTIEARAGYASGYGDPEFVAQLPVFNLPQLPRDKKYRMFPVAGDSMRPFPERMSVLAWYVEDWRTVKAGTLCIVVSRTEGIVFKQVAVEPEGLLLTSLNALYNPYKLPFDEVIEVWRYHSYMTEIVPAGDISMDMLTKAIAHIRTTNEIGFVPLTASV